MFVRRSVPRPESVVYCCVQPMTEQSLMLSCTRGSMQSRDRRIIQRQNVRIIERTGPIAGFFGEGRTITEFEVNRSINVDSGFC